MDTLITAPGAPGIDFWWIAGLLVAVYELLVRYIPTVADYSIIGFIYRILDYLVENRAVVKDEDSLDSESKAVLKQESTKRARPLFRIAKRVLKRN